MLDTLTLILALNVSCAMFDGATSLYCYPGYESGTVIVLPETGPARLLVGEYPTAGDFLIAGVVEVAVMTAVSAVLRRYGIKRWYVPQIAACVVHLGFGVWNAWWYSRNMGEIERMGL